MWRPWPLSSAPVHTHRRACTQEHTHTHTRGITLCKRKAIHHRRGTSRPFYSTNCPPPPRLPDVTSQQSEITFSGIIIIHTHTHTQNNTHILSHDFFLYLYLLCFFSLALSVCTELSLINPCFAQINRHQTVMNFFFSTPRKETLKSNHERSQFKKDFPRMCSEICSSDQLSVYSL